MTNPIKKNALTNYLRKTGALALKNSLACALVFCPAYKIIINAHDLVVHHIVIAHRSKPHIKCVALGTLDTLTSTLIIIYIYNIASV